MHKPPHDSWILVHGSMLRGVARKACPIKLQTPKPETRQLETPGPGTLVGHAIQGYLAETRTPAPPGPP